MQTWCLPAGLRAKLGAGRCGSHPSFCLKWIGGFQARAARWCGAAAERRSAACSVLLPPRHACGAWTPGPGRSAAEEPRQRPRQACLRCSFSDSRTAELEDQGSSVGEGACFNSWFGGQRRLIAIFFVDKQETSISGLHEPSCCHQYGANYIHSELLPCLKNGGYLAFAVILLGL